VVRDFEGEAGKFKLIVVEGEEQEARLANIERTLVDANRHRTRRRVNGY